MEKDLNNEDAQTNYQRNPVTCIDDNTYSYMPHYCYTELTNVNSEEQHLKDCCADEHGAYYTHLNSSVLNTDYNYMSYSYNTSTQEGFNRTNPAITEVMSSAENYIGNKLNYSFGGNLDSNNFRCDQSSCLYDDDTMHTREDATQRERNRMHLLNDAFDDLRKAVPRSSTINEHQKLSKIATLRFAIQYISTMIQALKESGAEVKLLLDSNICDRRGRRRGRLRRNCGIYKRPPNT